MKPILFFLAALTLSGCATQQLAMDRGPTPAQVVASGEAHSTVHWGGQIVKVENLHDRTLVEVLAFPLASNGRPLSERAPEGRFVIDKSGFLEPHEYSVNRLLEVRGQLKGFSSGRVGEADYRYPVVTAERLTLWPDDAAYSSRPGVPGFTIGIGAGSHGGGAGIGIGF